MRPLVLLLAATFACAPADPGPADSHHAVDAGDGTDAGEAPDAGDAADAGDAPDAGPVTPLPGFGTLSGDCNVLDDELLSDDDSIVRNTIDFGTNGFDASEKDLLSDGGEVLYDTPNAGGSSALSEVFAFEVLHRCELATLLKTETEIEYDVAQTKITDILVEIDGLKIGVSVVRAVTFPRSNPYTPEEGDRVLRRKLEAIAESTLNVSDEDRWEKQVLHAIAYGPQHAEVLEDAWLAIEDAVRGDTVLMITTSDGDDEFLYSN